jgi:hypothetical protein
MKMDQTEQRFQSFLTRIKPHRVAVFANTADSNWYQNCLGIIEFLTKLWGGSHCVIIPTDGKTIREEFWTILSSHDPDIFYRYQPTGADRKERAPDQFEAIVAEQVRKWVIETGLQEVHARIQVEKGILEANFDQWSISDELREEILTRLAPFHFEKQPFHGMPNRQMYILAISKGSKPNHPLTAIVDIVRAGNPRTRVTQIGVNDTTDAAIAPPKLWLAATIGCGDQEYFKELSEQQVEPVWMTVNEFHTLERIIRLGVRPWRYTVDAFPFGLTRAALTSVRAVAAHRFELPTIVVVGNSLDDFCLYFNLYWQQGRALWLPPWFMPEDGKYPDRLLAAIHEAEDAARVEHNEHFVLVSYSTSQGELLKLSQTLNSHMFRTGVDVQEITTEIVKQQVAHPSRLYADGDLGNITTHSLLNNSLPGFFESPVLRTLKPASPLSHRWIVDIVFMHNLIPRHPVLDRVVVNGSNVSDMRAGVDTPRSLQLRTAAQRRSCTSDSSLSVVER